MQTKEESNKQIRSCSAPHTVKRGNYKIKIRYLSFIAAEK